MSVPRWLENGNRLQEEAQFLSERENFTILRR